MDNILTYHGSAMYYLYYLILKQSTGVDKIFILILQKKKLKIEEIKQVESNKRFGIGSPVYLMQNPAFLARVRPYYTLEKQAKNIYIAIPKINISFSVVSLIGLGFCLFFWPPSILQGIIWPHSG